MKQLLTSLCLLFGLTSAVMAQTDVTAKYIENPDFAARFAAWENAGSMTFNTATSFSGKSGDVWMEKWVASGGKLNNNNGIYQQLRNLPTGTYTLTAAAQHINQANKTATCTGAFLYADDASTEIHEAADYSTTFTVIDGRATVGVKLVSATGNWLCVDNFRLVSNGVDQAAIDAEIDKLVAEAEGVLKADGATASELQSAIDAAKAIKGQGADGVKEVALALERATLNFRVQNATGTAPKVTTHPFVAMGTTIALGRLNVTGTSAERGFCWSKDPNPTILDETSTLYYNNNGNIYHMDGLEPGTIYYVRAYARTSGYKVGYGDVVKIATLPKGQVNYSYDFAGDEMQNARINSASAETVWMYNNLSNIRGFYLQVHYVYGAGAGDGTADCSYGGWMRVSQKEAYQQTGTILHETNHGVGVGTTGAWYNNSNLRAETSRGLWLGPRATEMVRFFDNNTTSNLNGDGTHMWPYGINGAHEDSYQPSNKALYYANILITHALHQDGLPCSNSVGFATPAYVFTQNDEMKYYIKTSDEGCGLLTSYLTATTSGTLKSVEISAAEARNDDNYAWYITYNPKTSLYRIQNVATGKYFTYASNAIKAASKTTPSTSEEFMLMPARQQTTMGTYKGTAYWIIKNSASNHPALQVSANGSTTAVGYNAANSATNQQWLFMSADDLDAIETQAISTKVNELTDLISNVRKVAQTAHVSRADTLDVATIDETLEDVLTRAESAEDYTSVSAINAHISDVEAALQQFLATTTPASVGEPYDLTFLLVNPDFAKDAEGWSTAATYSYSCCEFFEKTFDFNQTTKLKLPAGTYEVRMQGFQRPGAYAAVYTDYVTNGKNNVNASLYAKTKNQKLLNIYDDAKTLSQGTGSVAAASKVYIPNTMQGASAFFKKGYYENSVLVTNASTVAIKVGVKGTAGTGYWTCFDNFRLLCHGAYTTDDVTPVQSIEAEETADEVYYDLSGRRVVKPIRGIYVRDGRKVIVK